MPASSAARSPSQSTCFLSSPSSPSSPIGAGAAYPTTWPGPRSSTTTGGLRRRRVEGCRELLDRRPLGVADLRPVLLVGLRHSFGDLHDELLVTRDLARCGLLLEQGDRFGEVLQADVLEFLRRVIPLRVRLLRHERVEQLALTVLLPRL